MMLKTPKSCIFGLICHKYKHIYISHSLDVCMSLSRVLKDVQDEISIYKQMIKEKKSLEFIVLDNINKYDTDVDIHLKIQYFIKHYKHLGYSLYNDKHRLREYKVKMEVSEDLKAMYVKLVCQSSKIIVGVFDKLWDAEEFMTEFEKMDIIVPVYAINKLSKEYFKSNRNHFKNIY